MIYKSIVGVKVLVYCLVHCAIKYHLKKLVQPTPIKLVSIIKLLEQIISLRIIIKLVQPV
jgi:hypothetical protein